MKKDYVPVSGEDTTAGEASFVERYWSDVWRNHDRRPDLSALARREEYRIMRPFPARLPKGSRVLDAGCGLGEWTVFLAQQRFDTVGIDFSADLIAKLKVCVRGRG
jgi:cyclopropane fatty-acyl-phospholipid synthase-like methyltransferase